MPARLARVVVALTAVGLAGATSAMPAPAGAALPPLHNLDPGPRADVRQDVPVTVVFVGLERGSGPMEIDGDDAFPNPGLPSGEVRVRTAGSPAGETQRDGTKESRGCPPPSR